MSQGEVQYAFVESEVVVVNLVWSTNWKSACRNTIQTRRAPGDGTRWL